MNQEEKKQMELLEQDVDLLQGEVDAKDALINEQKKMIICGLCDRIEVSRDYEVRIVVDMDYGQFCG